MITSEGVQPITTMMVIETKTGDIWHSTRAGPCYRRIGPRGGNLGRRVVRVAVANRQLLHTDSGEEGETAWSVTLRRGFLEWATVTNGGADQWHREADCPVIQEGAHANETHSV